MADTLKVLAQSNPSATTLTDIYTVPASTSTSISSVVVANRSATATSFRLAVAPAGAANSNEHYLYYDQVIDGNSSFVITVGITMATTDVLRVYATLATLSFNVFGVEVA